MKRWYVAETHPHAEGRAQEHLVRQGYEIYLPRYRRSRRHARKRDTVLAPLFPGYLFIGMDLARTRWRAIRSTIGVRHLISDGERPVSVPEGVVESIRASADDDGVIPLAPAAPFKPGEEVEITEGPLRLQVGWFQRVADRERVVILLTLLGRQVPFTVPLAALRQAF